MDDKILVIICATLIGGVAMFALEESNAVTIAASVISLLGGVAVGKRL